MNRRDVLLTGVAAAGAAGLPVRVEAQAKRAPAIAGLPDPAWASRAETLTPVLSETVQPPLHLVTMTPAASSPLRFNVAQVAPASALEEKTWRRADSFILDFGGHRTGYFGFALETVGREPDSPVRLRLTFGEVPTDVAEPLHPYAGTLSEAWLPEEVVTIDYLPQRVALPRRYAFRYVKVEVIDSSSGFAVRFRDVHARAVTSAGPLPVPVGSSPLLRRIDEVAMATLRDCMQTTFEDGPRRDQRLWVGDLRLQALTSYSTLRNDGLVRRCLYLFAAYRDHNGMVAACVYEKPRPRYGGIHIIDYSALFNVTLRDYLKATGDLATARELWPVAARQLELIERWITPGGLFVDPGDMWIFIDWAKDLHKGAAIQGLLAWAWEASADLARRLGLVAEANALSVRAESLRVAGRKAYFHAPTGRVASGPAAQSSVAGATWLVLAGALTRAEARRAMVLALDDSAAVKPVTPYLYHYAVEALLGCGLKSRARGVVESYWGAMVEAGADTFWEVFDPAQPLSSPYGDIHINSFCHAWSCTPSHFIRAGQLG